MFALIARGCFTTLLSRHGRQCVPRNSGQRLQTLPPDAIAAVPHHRRP